MAQFSVLYNGYYRLMEWVVGSAKVSEVRLCGHDVCFVIFSDVDCPIDINIPQ